jgi:hypothetical protein
MLRKPNKQSDYIIFCSGAALLYHLLQRRRMTISSFAAAPHDYHLLQRRRITISSFAAAPHEYIIFCSGAA